MASGIIQPHLSTSLVNQTFWLLDYHHISVNQVSLIIVSNSFIDVFLLQVTDRPSYCLTAVNMSIWRSVFCAATWTCWFRRAIGGARWPQEAWLPCCCHRIHSVILIREFWPLSAGENIAARSREQSQG